MRYNRSQGCGHAIPRLRSGQHTPAKRLRSGNAAGHGRISNSAETRVSGIGTSDFSRACS